MSAGLVLKLIIKRFRDCYRRWKLDFSKEMLSGDLDKL